MNVLEAMQAMTGRFDPAKARGVNAVVQINANGDGGGKYAITIKDGAATLQESAAEKPNVTVDVAAQDWLAILGGEMDPTVAFMSGKLRISGDLGLMMRFQQIFM
ncbi:MAG: SCP2 sterol-binding domain-containing protein [Thermoflexales bacterium]|nr:SCP2 sterol-binding domain-containing protein [Thermoflexales bacterium]